MAEHANRPENALRRVEGVQLALRVVERDDAEYIHGLRTDPAYNTHLSEVTGTAVDQRNWIARYKSREADGHEYYYVIERLCDGQRCGLVRLYDITDDRFTWGSWILDENKPPKAALESAVLSFGTGFDQLGKELAFIDVRRGNTRAISFYRGFGMTETGADELDLYFTYSADQFRADRARHLSVVRESVSS